MWKLVWCGMFHTMMPTTHAKRNCGATFGKTSLNKELLQGPDLANTLLGVLLHFRQGPVALIPNIEGMFNQVQVAEEGIFCGGFSGGQTGISLRTSQSIG